MASTADIKNGIVINCSIVMSKEVSKINDRARIGYGTKRVSSRALTLLRASPIMMNSR
jgi:hypothetical protein